MQRSKQKKCHIFLNTSEYSVINNMFESQLDRFRLNSRNFNQNYRQNNLNFYLSEHFVCSAFVLFLQFRIDNFSSFSFQWLAIQ